MPKKYPSDTKFNEDIMTFVMKMSGVYDKEKRRLGVKGGRDYASDVEEEARHILLDRFGW